MADNNYEVGDLVHVRITRNHKFTSRITEVHWEEEIDSFGYDESCYKYWFINDGWHTWAYANQMTRAGEWSFYLLLFLPAVFITLLFTLSALLTYHMIIVG